jgi:hypothetical protein
MIQRALRGLRKVLTALDLRSSASVTMHGITVFNTSDRCDADTVFSSVDVALNTLKKFDRRRLGVAQQHLRRIVVAAQSTNAYWRHAHACVLSDTKLPEQPPVWTASVIVHEAVHARLYRCGIEPRDPTMRARIEALCVKEQIRFLKRIPDSEAMIDHLRSELAAGDWFTSNGRRRATIDRLRALDAPSWLVRWMERREFR